MTINAGNVAVSLTASTTEFTRGMQTANQHLSNFERATGTTTRGVTMMERGFATLAVRAAGVEGPVGKVAEGLLMFGAGGEVTIAVLAGLAAGALAVQTFGKGWVELKERLDQVGGVAAKFGDSELKSLTTSLATARTELKRLNDGLAQTPGLLDQMMSGDWGTGGDPMNRAKSLVERLTGAQNQAVFSTGMGSLTSMTARSGSPQSLQGFATLAEQVAAAARALLASSLLDEVQKESILSAIAKGGLPAGVMGSVWAGFGAGFAGPYRGPTVFGGSSLPRTFGGPYDIMQPRTGLKYFGNDFTNTTSMGSLAIPKFGANAASQIFGMGRTQAGVDQTTDAVTKATNKVVLQLGLVAGALDLLTQAAGVSRSRIGGLVSGLGGILGQAANLAPAGSDLAKSLPRLGAKLSIAGIAFDVGAALFGALNRGPSIQDQMLKEQRAINAALQVQINLMQKDQFSGESVVFTRGTPDRGLIDDLLAGVIGNINSRRIVVRSG